MSLLLVALVGVGITRVIEPAPQPSACWFVAPTGARLSLSAEQAGHASTIAAVSVRRGLPPRAATIGIATALQESRLHNLPGGDRDSLGLFQQRPSQGWGTPEQIGDPVYASDRFFEALEKVPGWQDLALTDAAQRVQRSAFPTAYAQHEDEAQVYAQALIASAPGAVSCRLAPVRQARPPQAVAAALLRETGLVAQVDDMRLEFSTATPQGAARAGAWAVAQAQRFGIEQVTVGDQVWRRGGSEPLEWSASGQTTDPTFVRVSMTASPEGSRS